MSNNNAVGSRVLLRIFLTVLITVSGLASCGGGGGSTTTNTTTPTTLSTFNITASSGSGGTITPSGATTVTQGASQSYTITPNLGYSIATLLVDGVSVSPSTTRTFTSVQADHTISVTFNAVPTYNITASAGSGGTVTPSGATTLTQGASQSYTITPGLGYIIATVLVDGNTVAASNAYTFTNVQANHSISATFSVAPTYTITASAGPNGTVTPSGSTTVTQGASQSYTISPNPGYIVATLMVDGTSVATSTTRTFTNVQANHSIIATFSAAPAGNIALSLVPARTSGVAPLAVFFDASATTDTGVTTHPFHDLEYTWSFGDSNAGTWAYGAQPGVSSKNSATGPVAAHVFETPGTYTVTLTAFDGTNSATINTTITVQDPNTVFAGTNTVCVSANNDPTPGSGGCPSGSAHYQDSSFPSIISQYALNGKRVLLKRGDTFTAPISANIRGSGLTVGAFGSGAKPKIQMTGNTDTLGFGAATVSGMVSDIRVMDLAFDGSGTSVSHGVGISSGSGGVTGVTLLRVDFANYETSIGFGADSLDWINNQHNWSHTIDQLTVVESTTTNGNNTSYSGYNSGNRVAFMGNHFDNGGMINRYDTNSNFLGNGTHVLRFTFLSKAVISNNDILHPGYNRHALKMHAPFRNGGVPDQGSGNWSNYSAPLNGDGYTKYVIIADNLFESGSMNAWQIAISPQDSASDERLHDILIERNVSNGNAYTTAFVTICAKQVTVRNNILFGSSDNSQSLVIPRLDGGEPPGTDMWIYNNTMYTSYAVPSSQFIMVDIQNSSLSNIYIKNNLAYAPNASGPLLYANAGASNVVVNNNSTDFQIKNTSPFATATPPADWKPLAGKYAVNGGSTVPSWSDFLRNNRPQGVIDIGAVETP